MYQSGQLPSKKYRALSWGLSTTVACTRVADDHPKKTCITVGAENHGSMYQSGRLPSQKYRALPWCLNTAVSVTNQKKLLPKRALEISIWWSGFRLLQVFCKETQPDNLPVERIDCNLLKNVKKQQKKLLCGLSLVLPRLDRPYMIPKGVICPE